MNRRIAAVVTAALLTAGCTGSLASMTQHWFYGFVAGVDEHELCLSDARVEDTEAERCFEVGDVDVADVGEGDLLKVRYERAEGGGHGGTLVEVRILRAADHSDR